MKKIKNCDLENLMLKLDYRGETALHDAIIVKLLNLGFIKEGVRTVSAKPDHMIFVRNRRFSTAHKDWVYHYKYEQVTLDDLYDLRKLIIPDTTITLADGTLIELSTESWNKFITAIKEEK